MEKPETLVTEFPEPADVKIYRPDLQDMPEAGIEKALYDSLGSCYDIQGFPSIFRTTSMDSKKIETHP